MKHMLYSYLLFMKEYYLFMINKLIQKQKILLQAKLMLKLQLKYEIFLIFNLLFE